MFELADRLVGIYKTDNCTKSVAINPGDFVVKAPTGEQEDKEQLTPNRRRNTRTAPVLAVR